MAREHSRRTGSRWSWALLIGAIVGAGDAAAERTQAPAEGRLDLREIARWLPGEYDNEPQRFFLEGMKRGADAPARRHVVIVPAQSDQKVQRFDVREHAGDERAPLARSQRWELSIDPRTHFVRMSIATTDGGGAKCSHVWRRAATVFRAEPLEGGCPTLTLSDEELWIDDPAARVAETLLRAQRHTCFVAVRLSDGRPHAVNGLATHDRGGSIDLVTPEATPRTLTLVLRRGLWPSNSGNNFVQLLNVYLYENGRSTLLGNGWATPESGRVGFASADAQGQRASARCKRNDVEGD